MIDTQTQWVWSRDAGATTGYRIAYFRRTFDVASHEARLTVHVSADSQYVLYVNGQRVARGPAKGDLTHQFYDTIDVSTHLRIGRNVLAAQVQCYATVWPSYSGVGAPVSVMTATSAFMLQGTLHESSRSTGPSLCLSTDAQWKAIADRAYSLSDGHVADCCSGMGEHVDGMLLPIGWTLPQYDDRDWPDAKVLAEAVTAESLRDSLLPYRLLPRMIPMLDESDDRFAATHQPTAIDHEALQVLIHERKSVAIAAHSRASFVLDAGAMVTAFPVLMLQGGRESVIRLTYAEAWQVAGVKDPCHRPDVGTIVGVHDQYRCRVGMQAYEPLAWRAFRYIAVEIVTADEPLVLSDVYYRCIAYPYAMQATFESSDPRHAKMFEMSWRTLQLCSHETFEDCPYYEQNQYVGDLQITMLLAGYAANDWALARQGIMHFEWSRTREGLTQSRYPSRVTQVLPTWSLLWVQTIRDYWWHTSDEALVQECLDGVRSVLQWFSRHRNGSGVLESLPYWNIVDWVDEWPMGTPPLGSDGVSAVLNLQYGATLLAAAELLELFEHTHEAQTCRDRAATINHYVNTHCWDDVRSVYVDCATQPDLVSELGNAWAILAGAATGERLTRVGRSLCERSDFARATLYGRFYVLRALDRAGSYRCSDDVFGPWTRLMVSGLTTWPEVPRLKRSFCHAWSAAPLYECLAEVLGIKPHTPGFGEIRIAPKTLDLTFAKGTAATPHGPVSVEWHHHAGEFQITVTAPTHLPIHLTLPTKTNELLIAHGIAITRRCAMRRQILHA